MKITDITLQLLTGRVAKSLLAVPAVTNDPDTVPIQRGYLLFPQANGLGIELDQAKIESAVELNWK